MKGKKFPRALAIILSICMLLAMVPSAAFASVDGYVSETHDVFKSTETTIAPGVTQKINYAYAKDGKQMVYYVATADVTRDDVVIQTSYLNQHENGILGMEKLTKQMAYANAKHVAFVALAGEQEIAEGKLTLKNMSTGEQTLVTPEQLLAAVSKPTEL